MTKTKTLSFPVDNFDQKNTFAFEFTGWSGKTRTRTGYLLTGYLLNAKREGTIYIMQRSACMKDVYTQADYEEGDRLAAMEPVRDGDVVCVDGEQYMVKILGNFSDAGRLVPMTPSATAKALAEQEQAEMDFLRQEIMQLEHQLAIAKADLAALQVRSIR